MQGFGRTEFIRWCQHFGFGYVIRLRPETVVTINGRRCGWATSQVADGKALLLSSVAYRGTKPVMTNIVVSSLDGKDLVSGHITGQSQTGGRLVQKALLD